MLKIVKIDQQIVYKVDIETNDGISQTGFTSKYNNHAMSFRNRAHENDLELSKFIWSLKNQNEEFDIQWSIFKKSSKSKSCNLCLSKNLVISKFQRDGEVTQLVIRSCVEVQA